MSKLRINELESLETGRSLKVDEMAQTFDYEAGIKITSYNQMVRDTGGELWRVSGQVVLPYVTSGSGLPEGDALMPVGKGVVAVDSIAGLLALPEGWRREGLQYSVTSFYGGKNQGGGLFLWCPTADKSLANGGTVIDPDVLAPTTPDSVLLYTYLNAQGTGTGNGCFVRQESSSEVETFGAIGNDSGFDCSAVSAKVMDSTGKAILKNHSKYYFIARGIQLLKDLNLEIADSTTVQISPHSVERVVCFYPGNAGNILVRGGEITSNEYTILSSLRGSPQHESISFEGVTFSGHVNALFSRITDGEAQDVSSSNFIKSISVSNCTFIGCNQRVFYTENVPLISCSIVDNYGADCDGVIFMHSISNDAQNSASLYNTTAFFVEGNRFEYSDGFWGESSYCTPLLLRGKRLLFKNNFVSGYKSNVASIVTAVYSMCVETYFKNNTVVNVAGFNQSNVNRNTVYYAKLGVRGQDVDGLLIVDGCSFVIEKDWFDRISALTNIPADVGSVRDYIIYQTEDDPSKNVLIKNSYISVPSIGFWRECNIRSFKMDATVVTTWIAQPFSGHLIKFTGVREVEVTNCTFDKSYCTITLDSNSENVVESVVIKDNIYNSVSIEGLLVGGKANSVVVTNNTFNNSKMARTVNAVKDIKNFVAFGNIRNNHIGQSFALGYSDNNEVISIDESFRLPEGSPVVKTTPIAIFNDFTGPLLGEITITAVGSEFYGYTYRFILENSPGTGPTVTYTTNSQGDLATHVASNTTSVKPYPNSFKDSGITGRPLEIAFRGTNGGIALDLAGPSSARFINFKASIQ